MLLAAVLSLVWYGALTNSTATPFEKQIVAILDLSRARTPPPPSPTVAEAPPAAQPVRAHPAKTHRPPPRRLAKRRRAGAPTVQ